MGAGKLRRHVPPRPYAAYIPPVDTIVAVGTDAQVRCTVGAMGQRSSTDTIVILFQAFLDNRTWKQAELARRAGVSSQVVRKRLEELSSQGVPLERVEETPHVFWSVPKGWFPGAVLFDSESVPVLLRLLSRLPQSKDRERLIRRILEAAPRPAPDPLKAPAVLTPRSSESEETYLPLVEDAATRRVCLEIKYHSSGRDDAEWRNVSVQSVVLGPPTRFIAFCHKTKALKWFRLDNVRRAQFDQNEPFREAEPGRVDAMLKESVDGFHQGGPVRCSFLVREPECGWVENNLPVVMTPEKTPGAMRFTTTTAGVLRLARFVVGLGAAAQAETPELAQLVEELARGALRTKGNTTPS